jgi:hypothetical protein
MPFEGCLSCSCPVRLRCCGRCCTASDVTEEEYQQDVKLDGERREGRQKMREKLSRSVEGDPADRNGFVGSAAANNTDGDVTKNRGAAHLGWLAWIEGPVRKSTTGSLTHTQHELVPSQQAGKKLTTSLWRLRPGL